MKHFMTIGAALGMAAILSAPAFAQGTITVLGVGTAENVSQDGTTVVGFSGLTGEAASWAGGVETDMPGSFGATGVNGDGSLVAGNLPDGGFDSAGRWDGAWTPTGYLDTCDFSAASPYDMDDSGNLIVGLAWEGCSGRAFRWTPGDGMSYLTQGPDQHSSRANVASGDGTAIGGWDSDSGQRLAAVWYGDDAPIRPLDGYDPILLPDGFGEVWGLSTDGTWVTGSTSNDLGPFIWSEATGVNIVGVLDGGSFFDTSALNAITDAGNCAVGYQGSNFGTPFRATIWTEEGGLESLLDWVTNQGIAIPPELAGLGDFALGFASDMTADGRTICGWSGDFLGQFPWRIDLDEAECFLVIGEGPGNDTFNPGLHSWNTSIGGIEDSYVVLMEDIPSFVIPSFDNVRRRYTAGTLGQGTFGGLQVDEDTQVMDWIADGTFAVQVVMWNPEVFPGQPEQFTAGLMVTIAPNGEVSSRPYGDSIGMDIWVETDVNANGDAVIRFPFSIDGL